MSLFLIHGWATNAMIWPDWLLTNTTYSYQSPDYPDYSQLAHAFLTHYKKQEHPLTLIGWSLGGMLALQLAADYPDKINKLILISSTPRFTSCEDFNAGLAPSIVKNLARKLQKKQWQTQLDFYHLMFAQQEQIHRENFAAHVAPSLANLRLPALQEGLNYLLETDLRSLLPSIQTPCHILHGTEDTICPPTAGRYLANRLPNSTITWVPGAGHIPFYTQEEYCKEVLFL